jgi:hypothetical protein
MEKSEMSAQHENSSTTIDERWGVSRLVLSSIEFENIHEDFPAYV